jgi:uncharacterized protein with HEPN domain
MKRKIHLYINDILENILFAEQILAGLDFQAFVANKEKNYSVVRCIEIIGEAVKSIPADIRDRYPDIPWQKMAGMRDKVIHFYLGVDHEIVWQAATNVLPGLKDRLKQIAREIE